MKKLLVVLVMLISVALASCEKTSDNGQPTGNEQTSNDKGFDGYWSVTVNGETQNVNIKTGSGYMNFNGVNYSGYCTSTYFSGENSVYKSGATTKTSLSVYRNGDNISGSITVSVTANGKTSKNSGSLSGRRI